MARIQRRVMDRFLLIDTDFRRLCSFLHFVGRPKLVCRRMHIEPQETWCAVVVTAFRAGLREGIRLQQDIGGEYNLKASSSSVAFLYEVATAGQNPGRKNAELCSVLIAQCK